MRYKFFVFLCSVEFLVFLSSLRFNLPTDFLFDTGFQLTVTYTKEVDWLKTTQKGQNNLFLVTNCCYDDPLTGVNNSGKHF